jgi:hypothetical protein
MPRRRVAVTDAPGDARPLTAPYARRRSAGLLALLGVALIFAACARAATVTTDRASLAAIEVRNDSGVTMIVAYEADGPRATLGAVTAGSAERFIIALPAGTSIRVFGTSETGARSSGPHALTLQAGTTQRVTLR